MCPQWGKMAHEVFRHSGSRQRSVPELPCSSSCGSQATQAKDGVCLVGASLRLLPHPHTCLILLLGTHTAPLVIHLFIPWHTVALPLSVPYSSPPAHSPLPAYDPAIVIYQSPFLHMLLPSIKMIPPLQKLLLLILLQHIFPLQRRLFKKKSRS